MHAHLSLMVYANCPRVTETGTRSHVKAEWCILPRPRRCFLRPSQGPGVTHGGTSSVSCPEAWASSRVVNSLDTAISPALRPPPAACLQGRSAAKGAAGNLWPWESREREQGEQREALSLWGGSGRHPSAFTFIFRSGHSPGLSSKPLLPVKGRTWIFTQELHLSCLLLTNPTPGHISLPPNSGRLRTA